MDCTIQTTVRRSVARAAEPSARAQAGIREGGEAMGGSGGVLGAMLDELDFGVCLCDAQARLIAANRSARVEMTAARALSLECGRIRPSLASCEPIFESALQDAALAGLRRMVWLGQGADRLVIAVAPASAAAEGGVVLLFGRRSFCSTLGLEMLAGAHGLTYGERRVLTHLLAGAKPAAIARTLGVSVYTIRTQIRSIRAKFSVDSIDALLIRVAAVPPVTTALRFSNLATLGASVPVPAF